MVGIHGHRVTDSMAKNGLADIFRVSFLVEFLGMDPDDQEGLIGEVLFELGQIGKDMEAINAAIGPEIQEHDLTAQVLFPAAKGAVGVEPLLCSDFWDHAPGILGQEGNKGQGGRQKHFAAGLRRLGGLLEAGSATFNHGAEAFQGVGVGEYLLQVA